mmetsp:Transcript_10204/g.24963  ORF Transcript_10204/g.24963 Transcript_10204/m.24963 type:complete len:218 (+) Transcript_10204:905-1558(+)
MSKRKGMAAERGEREWRRCEGPWLRRADCRGRRWMLLSRRVMTLAYSQRECGRMPVVVMAGRRRQRHLHRPTRLPRVVVHCVLLRLGPRAEEAADRGGVMRDSLMILPNLTVHPSLLTTLPPALITMTKTMSQALSQTWSGGAVLTTHQSSSVLGVRLQRVRIPPNAFLLLLLPNAFLMLKRRHHRQIPFSTMFQARCRGRASSTLHKIKLQSSKGG